MWQLARLAVQNPKLHMLNPFCSFLQRQYSTKHSIAKRSGKVVLGIILSAGLGFGATVVYSQYNPQLKSWLEENLPHISHVHKVYPNDFEKTLFEKVESIKEKIKLANKAEFVILGHAKEKPENEKASAEETKSFIEREPKTKINESSQSQDNTDVGQVNVSKTVPQIEQPLKSSSKQENLASYENSLNETIENVRKKSEDAISAYDHAIYAVKLYTKKLHDAHRYENDDVLLKEANEEKLKKKKILELAKQKAVETEVLLHNMLTLSKKLAHFDSNNPLIKTAEQIASKHKKEIEKAELEIKNAETEAKNSAHYKELKMFQEDLEVEFPNYIQNVKSNALTMGDLSILLKQAHQRLENLQEEIAALQKNEKIRLEEAVKSQKAHDDLLIKSKIKAELHKQRLDFEKYAENRIASLKANYEAKLHQQLLRQAAVHVDHLKEALEQQKQELEKNYMHELEEELLNQKGIFLSETCKNSARLMGVIDYLKAKSKLDESSKKAQHLWLACQALYYKITMDKSGNLCPLVNDISVLKIVSEGENSDFLDSVLSSIPSKAASRGVYVNEVLKERFEEVKHVCKQVALIDENKDSLYRYFLSYIQSLLIFDSTSVVGREEHEEKIADDVSEWDTFDILSRISYCLKSDDLEQALRYANQLKGEPRIVAKDWMNEVRLSLETQLAVKALLAHAAAVSVQAYH